MNRFVLLAAVALSACSATTATQENKILATVPGQLFCAIQKNGVSFVAPIVQSGITGVVATAAAGPAGALADIAAVLVINQSAAWVQARCDDAAKAVGATAAIPVAPPTTPVQAPVAIPPAV